MKKLTVAFVFIFFTPFLLSAQSGRREIGNLVMENIPEIPEALKDRMNQYQNARGAGALSWKPDGKGMLMATRFAETAQIHFIEKPGGARTQLTFFKEPVGGASYCPNPDYKGFMFTKDVGGNEFRQLYWFDLGKGSYEMLSDGGRTQNSGPSWSEDGNRFVYVSTRRNGRDYDLYLSTMEKPKEAKLILAKGGSWAPGDWSPDGKFIVVMNYISANKSFVHILNLETLELSQVNPSDEDIAYGAGVWSADGKGIFYSSDEGTEYSTLRYYDLASKKSSSISAGIPWDVNGLIVDKKRKTMIFATNENGITRLYKLNMATRRYAALPGLPTSLISLADFHPDGNSFSLVINSPSSPSDIYTYDLKKHTLTQWTYSEVGGLDNTKFVASELIQYETFDKVDGKPRLIPAFYYKPAAKGKKFPVVINIHGGPEGQSVPSFSAFRSYLTNEMGIAVIDPNVRGSTGYGKTFVKLDNGYLREESVMDIGALLDWIARQPELDASRVAVMGGSYGGYMVLASMVHYSDRLRCGVDVVGISNFVTFLQNTEDYRKDLRRVEYGDERDPAMRAFLEKISPLNHVDKITKPLFIVQGLNDPRVPASESEQMKRQLQQAGQEVWYLLAKDEGHGFRKKENSSFQQWATVLFFEKYLLD